MHLNQRDYVEIEISKRIKIIDSEDSPFGENGSRANCGPQLRAGIKFMSLSRSHRFALFGFPSRQTSRDANAIRFSQPLVM